MRGLIVIAVMAVAVSARPEPPRGYSYQAPAPIPVAAPPVISGGYSSSGGGYNSNAQYSSASNGFSQGFGVSSHSSHNIGHGQQQSFAQVASSFNSAPQQSFSQNSFQQQSFAAAAPQTVVQKHIYVHVPPPEEEYEVAQQQQQLSAPRKHYKIIFIKAPSAPSITQQIAQAQAQSQEKTLIYVLVKKPEDITIGSGPSAAPALPVSKPEVYFIKYKTQKEQAAAGVDFSSGGQVSSNANVFSGSSSITDYNAPAPASQYGPPAHKK